MPGITIHFGSISDLEFILAWVTGGWWMMWYGECATDQRDDSRPKH